MWIIYSCIGIELFFQNKSHPSYTFYIRWMGHLERYGDYIFNFAALSTISSKVLGV